MATALTGRPLVEAAWKLLRRDPSVVWLLIIGGAGSAAAFWLIVLPLSMSTGAKLTDRTDPTAIVIYALALFASTFVSTFFLGAVSAAAMQRADGGDPTFGSAVGAAWRRRSQLVAWAAMSTAVGVALRLLQRFGLAGLLARLLAGGSWAVATWFAIPVIMAEGTMPGATIRRSTKILTARLGSNARSTFRLGAYFFVAQVVLFVIGMIGLFLLFGAVRNRDTGGMAFAFTVVALWILGSFLLSAVSSSLSVYLRTVLYRYANDLPIPGIPGYALPALLGPSTPGSDAFAGASAFGASPFGTASPNPPFGNPSPSDARFGTAPAHASFASPPVAPAPATPAVPDWQAYASPRSSASTSSSWTNEPPPTPAQAWAAAPSAGVAMPAPVAPVAGPTYPDPVYRGSGMDILPSAAPTKRRRG